MSNSALHFEVVGRLWSGHKAAYQYSITENAPFWPRKLARLIAEQIRNPAGSLSGLPPSIPHMDDFASIDDVRIVHERNDYAASGRLLRRTDTFTTLAGWAHQGSRGTYSRLTFARSGRQ